MIDRIDETMLRVLWWSGGVFGTSLIYFAVRWIVALYELGKILGPWGPA